MAEYRQAGHVRGMHLDREVARWERAVVAGIESSIKRSDSASSPPALSFRLSAQHDYNSVDVLAVTAGISIAVFK